MPPMSPRYTRLTAGLKLWSGTLWNRVMTIFSVNRSFRRGGRLGHKLEMITRPCFESEEELASPVRGAWRSMRRKSRGQQKADTYDDFLLSLLARNGGMATGTSVLQNTNALHNELSEQLAQMATQLKCNALHFSDSLSADKAIVEEAQQKIESNFNFMRKERKTSGTFASIL
ncbi:hypothetical protein EV421DRAFT_2023647 [Armillaria borealis]|uniref:Uncharacterized protein n=1 Tax=Armillaria borealis TaxID=47425 RepID=A0AA39MFL5_9AGAR|nr:hypothetical protein EV421DRAFT_2023647 [Armillaria borealis]